MKIQLIMLPQPIIVSDEEIKEGDLYEYLGQITTRFRKNPKAEYPYPHYKKIIAQSNQIDWNGLEDQFGYVDLKQLAWKQTNRLAYSGLHADRSSECFIWIDGFKKAQELNDKKFSLEDMESAFYAKEEANLKQQQIFFEDLIKGLSKPKTFDIEVEMEMKLMKGVECEAYKCNHPLDPEEWTCDSRECFEADCKMLRLVPKVTEGKIKIIKKL